MLGKITLLQAIRTFLDNMPTRKSLRRQLGLLINVLFVSFYIPVFFLLLIPLLLVNRARRKKRFAIFAGLEHVVEKTVIRAEYMRDSGFGIRYYSFEQTGNSLLSTSKSELVKADSIWAVDSFRFVTLLLVVNPIYIEMYFENACIQQIFYTIAAKANNSFVISILRGELYKFEEKPLIRNHLRLISWRLSDRVFYRELYMEAYFEKLRFNQSRLFFDPNKVRTKTNVRFERNKKNVLFLNGLKKWRRIDLFINSIPLVVAEVPDATFTIVGCRDQNEFDYAHSLVRKADCWGRVSIHYWSSEPEKFFENASVFVLPADLIFCNFSLLEAMERGVPPIVSDVQDAEKIVRHEINGLLAKQSSEDIARHVVRLLVDESFRLSLAEQSRVTIINDYNDERRMEPVLALLKERYKKEFESEF